MPPPTLNSEEPLNAPFGARCFLTPARCVKRWRKICLNAPFGARCFLTRAPKGLQLNGWASLNAPFGARCFLTYQVR